MISLHPRGFTLLIAVVLSSVLLTIGIALLDVAYKQVILASTARQSVTAFYAADTALECALYWDQQEAAFDSVNPPATIQCGGQSITPVSTTAGGIRTTRFTVPCVGGGTRATVDVLKSEGTAFCNSGVSKTCLYSYGYNTCDANDPRRIERGLKATY